MGQSTCLCKFSEVQFFLGRYKHSLQPYAPKLQSILCSLPLPVLASSIVALAPERLAEAYPHLSPCSNIVSGSCYLGLHSCRSRHMIDMSSWCVLPLHLLSNRWDSTQMHTYMKISLVLPRIVISLFSALLFSQYPRGHILAGFTEELLCLVSVLALHGPYLALFASSVCLWQRLLGVPQYLLFLLPWQKTF